ncbi:MAG: hypothetical protein CL821_00045 [Crocinitomicaceae bacterium]|nr:hypothetical protein [Crocinitomicaceae bacterium]
MGDNLVREPVDQLGFPTAIEEQYILPIDTQAAPGVKLVVALLFPQAVFGGFPGCILPASHDNLVNVS